MSRRRLARVFTGKAVRWTGSSLALRQRLFCEFGCSGRGYESPRILERKDSLPRPLPMFLGADEGLARSTRNSKGGAVPLEREGPTQMRTRVLRGPCDVVRWLAPRGSSRGA